MCKVHDLRDPVCFSYVRTSALKSLGASVIFLLEK